ncbi:MAG: phosphoserine phosphatase SerB, partial [Roseovarius sp.]
MFTATLIAPPGALDPALVVALQGAWGGGDALWLAPDEAAEFALPHLPDNRAEVWRNLQVQGVDLVVQPAKGRRKKMLLADMDSTMIRQECIDELAEVAGVGAQVRDITARAMNGELDFKEALRARVGRLKGLSTDALADAYADVELSPGAETLVRTMAKNGAHCVLVSGGFKYFTSRIGERCGFHEDLSNDFVIENGKLTGAVVEPILDKDVKLETLIKRTAEHGLSLARTLSVGDGANDLPMLKAAGLGVAY